ncbi:MAG: PadR family transcriptional regulator [Myxococcaceae bacterium]
MHERHWDWERHFMGRGFRGRRGGGADFWEVFGGPPPRADRGAVRYLVLDAIEKQARHGYEIMQAIEERSGRTYRPSPGVIYPTLQLLEELGHARVEEQEGRKVYAITADGKRDLEEHRDEVKDFYERSGAGSWEEYAEELGDLIKHATRLFKVFRHSARHGRLSPVTMKKVRGVLDEAMAKIEALVDTDRS